MPEYLPDYECILYLQLDARISSILMYSRGLGQIYIRDICMYFVSKTRCQNTYQTMNVFCIYN